MWLDLLKKIRRGRQAPIHLDDQRNLSSVLEVRRKYEEYDRLRGPCDRAACQKAVSRLYEAIGLKPPAFVWFDSPMEGVSAIALTYILDQLLRVKAFKNLSLPAPDPPRGPVDLYAPVSDKMINGMRQGKLKGTEFLEATIWDDHASRLLGPVIRMVNQRLDESLPTGGGQHSSMPMVLRNSLRRLMNRRDN